MKELAGIIVYSEFFLRLAIGFYMLIFQPPVCPHENIQPIFPFASILNFLKAKISSDICNFDR
jgi:hypothetical protein